MTEENKTTILMACAQLASYQRYLESKGNANNAIEVKDTISKLKELMKDTKKKN